MWPARQAGALPGDPVQREQSQLSSSTRRGRAERVHAGPDVSPSSPALQARGSRVAQGALRAVGGWGLHAAESLDSADTG